MPHPDYQLPVIHLNGSGRQSLLDYYKNAYRKAIELRDSLNTGAFHGRDYYPAGAGAWAAACDQRREQEQRLAELMRYLEAHLAHLASP